MNPELFAVPLGASLTAFGVLGLVVHALVVLFSRVSAFKRYTAKQMLIALLVMLSGSLAAGGRVVVRAVGGLLRWWLLVVVVFTSFSFLYVTYTEYPSIWVGSVRFYNSSVGPLVHHLVVVPLQITDVLLRGFLPLWDATWWFFKTLLAQGLLPVVIEEFKIVLQMATTLLSLFEHLSNSLVAFVEGFFCDGAACLHPERGILDLLSPMGDVREFAALGVKLLRQVCSTLAGPLDLAVFPLLDLNLAECVHNIGNAVVQLLVVIPRSTVVRCALATGDQFHVLMCTPDLAPSFNFLVAGLSSLGQALDNWVNAAFLIVQTLVGAEQEQDLRCDTAATGMLPDYVAADAVFNGSRTVIVGLTDWMYAVTDGVTAVYMGHNDPGQAKVQVWPYPGMDVSMGVAAVTYSSVHDLDVSAFSSGKTVGSMQTTAMLACNCTDDALLGMRILCSILPMTGIPSASALEDYLVQVLFPDTDASSLYTCRGVDVYVKSVRWSYTRYSSQDATLGSAGGQTTLPTTDCIARGTCRELDATVWMVPRCGQEENQNGEKACLPEAPCFPFCMAARSAGGGRDNLILARAARWREGLVVLGQDCALETSTPGTVGPNMGGVSQARTSWTGTAYTGVSPSGSVSSGIYASTYKPQECRRSPRVTSILNQTLPGSRAAAANVRLGGQPFAITGDTTLMEVGGAAAAGGGTRAVEQLVGSVQVERLMGNEIDAFSLHPMAQTLPSLQRVLVPMSEAERVDTSRVTVPYSYGTTRVAATNSRNYVFYASNPNLDVYGAYFEYCGRKENKALARFGLLAKSSFAPMRVYRVSAYRRCATYSCGADLVRFVTIDGFNENFDKECAATFNVSVVALEYLNEDNIAVTVQSSHVREYNTLTLRFSGPRTQTTTYWLNPASMGLRRTIWQTAVPSSNFAVLCPSLQRLPRVGSFAIELVNSVVFLIKTLLSAVLYTPGMVPVWRAGGTCPPVGGAAKYHSVLGGCGSGLYSLDDFFDSVDDSAAIFWHSLSLIGKLIASTSSGVVEKVTEPLTRVMDGTSQYGTAMIDMWSARAGVLTLTRVPIKEQVDSLWASMQPAAEGGTRQQGLSYGSSALSGWSRFSYKALSTITLNVVKRALDTTGGAGTGDELTASKVFQLIWKDMYDLKDEFEATITNKNRMGCAGLRLIFGSDNPWANLVYHQCAAITELTGDLMMGLGLNMFVLIPMAKCVCKDSRGSDVGTYVVEVCAPSMPVSLLPTLFTIANEARVLQQTAGFTDLQCEAVLKHVRGEISGSLDSWFDHQHLALQALGSAVDYATASFDSKAGKCMDYKDDPHVVVMVPQPVDYFQRCAGTSLCKGPGGKCRQEWVQFQQAMGESKSPVANSVVSMDTESSFFPGGGDTTTMMDDASLALSNAMATVEVPSSQGVCLARPRTSPPDYVLAVAELEGSAGVRVQYWCAPLMSSSGVYRSESNRGYGPTTLPGAVLSVQFGDDTGKWVMVLVQGEAGQRVYLVNQTGQFITPSFSDRLGPSQILMRVENMWAVEGGILVDLVTRRMVATGSKATTMGLTSLSETVHLFLVPPLGEPDTNTSVTGIWHGTPTDLMQYGGGLYWYTRLPDHEYLFVPRSSGNMMLLSMYRLSLTVLSGGAKVLWLQLQETNGMGLVGGVDLSSGGTAIMAAVSQSKEYVFSTRQQGGNWLRQTRFDPDGYVLGSYGSAKMTTEATIEGGCDEMSCEGCSTLATQRLCMAYSQCALMNCVGTAVHQTRPLCGIGGLLRHWGEMALKSTHGSWTIFTEMLGLTLELNLLTLHEAHLLWPEDSFLCYTCQAKDATAQFFSILTATINSALQMGEANIAYMYGGASNIDTNADAALTISSTALNGFMHQTALLPLYLMIASRQVMMCQVSGVLALVDAGGFKLSLKNAGKASAADIVAGQCLTVGAEVLANYPGDSPRSVAATVGSIASNAAQLLLIQQIEPLLHLTDAFLAYAIGVVHALGVLVMSHNMARCNPPTLNMTDILQCACGDHRLQIPGIRRKQGVSDGALWCTGVLSMIDSNNQPYFVYNKYTYEQLQAMNAGLDAYAKCLGAGTTGYKCSTPTPPNASDARFFSQQGVSVANVLVKCRENFAKKQWDPYAFALYNRDYHRLFDKRLGYRVSIPEEDPFGIKGCMQQVDPTATGSLSQTCLKQFLSHPLVDLSLEDYWAYERVDTGKPGSQFTDACLVFSGPADLKLPLFIDCVDGADSDGSRCRLAGHAWTPLSENQVPVAAQHRVMSYGVHSEGLVQRLYSEARSKVVDAVAASIRMQASNSDHVEVEFFSVEGDVLHQIMDCMFMGPYSRVDYWPIPACSGGQNEEECLIGPYWSRDEESGKGRGVDPDSCPTLPSLPYTCGSPSRKAVMRYLVQDWLTGRGTPRNQNGSVIHETILSTLGEIMSDWNNTAVYGCPCQPYFKSFSPVCCLGWKGDLLPAHLNKSYIPIDSSKVLKAMEDDLGDMYRLALEDIDPWRYHLDEVAPGEAETYAAWNQSRRVQDEARFDPTNPVAGYTSADEALSPVSKEDGGTLWDVCHASLKQTFFTLPLGPDGEVMFDPELSKFDGDPAKLQAYVKAFTWEAWRHSPLFRHYSPRHMPSESHMCRPGPKTSSNTSGSRTNPVAPGKVSFTAFTQRGATLVPSTDFPSDIDMYPPQQFPVGATDLCVCGWPRVGKDLCQPSPVAFTRQLVCAVKGVVCDGNFTYRASTMEALVVASFSPAWHCPEFELSPHWGFTDAKVAEEWLGGNATALSTSSRDLLKHGRAGLRIGNVQYMAGGGTKASINPTTRRIPLEHGQLTTCSPPDPLGVAQELMDELFPAAQAVDEAGAVAYCVRYIIELARLEILGLPILATTMAGEQALQKERVSLWRRRCGAQLHLLHLCKNLGVFGPRLGSDVSCQHFNLSQTDPVVTRTSAFVTKECLVGAETTGQGFSYYDPCRCLQCAGDKKTVLDLSFVLATDQCKIRFDPRSMLEGEGASRAPIGWLEGGFHPLLDPASSLLADGDFASDVMEDRDAVGNTEDPSIPWWQVEGPMGENSEFCDGVLDWWPEEWAYPVGYHVTVPCDANDTAYRSFAQAFALDENHTASATLVYQHDLLRDADLVDSHFGVGGLCRRGSFGMPLYETNNMRYCTSLPLGEGSQEDFTVPREKTYAGSWTPMKCAPSSRDLPWPDSTQGGGSYYDSSLFSVGTVPHMPPEDASFYPETSDDMSELGPWQEVIAGGDVWGKDGEASLCQDFHLALCAGDSACPTGFRCRGMVCSGDRTRRCESAAQCLAPQTCGGVCMDDTSLDCIRHSDCKNPALMCSGVGKCVQPTLVVHNRLEGNENNISLGMAVGGGGEGDCGDGAREYTMVAGSYWGNTGPDLLRVHGMCSFEDWFKYTDYYGNSREAGGCATPTQTLGGRALRVDPRQCSIMNLARQLQNQTTWWPPGLRRPELMYLRPTNCDRDYERLKNFTQCAPLPGVAKLLFPGGTETSATEYNILVNLHSLGPDGNPVVLLADMPERNDTRFGVLGLSGVITQASDLDPARDVHPFVPCALIGQCFAPPFTVDGEETNRTFADVYARRRAYPDDTVFKCGVFGLEDPQRLGCKLDREVLPLYRALCMADDAGGIRECKDVLAGGAARLCENIRDQYQPTNLDRSSNLASLKELFYGFPLVDGIDQYLDLTQCMLRLHEDIASRAVKGVVSKGLYYPFMFVLKELPFDWFYQCIVLGGLRVNEETWRTQDCLAYKDRGAHLRGSYKSVSPGGDSLQTYLRYVRGGYTRAGVEQFLADGATRTRAAVREARLAVQRVLYPASNGEDGSYPICSKNTLWKIGEYGTQFSATDVYDTDVRAIIANWFDPQECRLTWLSSLISNLPPGSGITKENWMDQLSYPDPVDTEPQSSVELTMMDAIQAFMLEGVGVKSAELIYTGDTGGLYFDNVVPDEYDLDRYPLSRDLTPMPSFRQGEVYTDTDDTTRRTCVFLPDSDPVFLENGVDTKACEQVKDQISMERGDTLKKCGSVLCSNVPVLARKGGLFNCRYSASGNIIPQPCTQDNGRTCAPLVLRAMYSEVLRQYKLSPVGSEVPPRTLPTVSLPWFEEPSFFLRGAWSFNLSNELDYERNIQPNPELSVMCDISKTDKTKTIKFMECNNLHYQKLKDHVNTHYRKEGAVVIPAGAQLEWPVDRGVLERGVILSYTRLSRQLNQSFMDALFTDQSVCKGVVTETQRVCWKKADLQFDSVNPWLLGNFNPFEACDVDFTDTSEGSKEYVYAQCLKEGNPLGRCERFLEQPVPKKCEGLNRKLVSFPGVPRSVSGGNLEYNLCFHKLDEDPDGCLHDQGLLGGFDGSPVAVPDEAVNMLVDTKYEGVEKYIIANSLYEESEWSIPDDFRQGLYADGRNPLWHNASAPYGHLQVQPHEIGGHRIGLVISRASQGDAISSMAVERLPMGTPETDSGFLNGVSQQNSRPTSEWVPGLQEAMAGEDYAARRLHIPMQNTTYLGASCALQRWMYYSGGYQEFSPAIPSAPRASHLFHGLHQGKLSHPTMVRASKGEFLGRYRSANGFCACPVIQDIDQPQCRIPSDAESSRMCSLAQTILALTGSATTQGEAFQSHVFPPLDYSRATRQCKMQLDWPNVGGTLRDGSTHKGDWTKASSPTHQECHVLDRFSPFRYQYRMSREPLREATGKPQGTTTVDQGVCQTARVVTLQRSAIPAQATRCLRATPYTPLSSSAAFTCDTPAPPTKPVVMPRRSRLSKEETLARRKKLRQSCSKCSPPPTFKSAGGKPIPPESSFGRLYRHSVERMLAKDLQDALLLAQQNSSETPAVLNASAWRAGEFMRNYMFTPHQLFLRSSKAETKAPNAAESFQSDDTSVWGKDARPWVYCPTPSSLKTGQECQGTMTKLDWVQRKKTLCPQMVRSYSSSSAANAGKQVDPMARTPFCLLDNSTDQVCKAVAEAKALVIQANCIASGDKSCMPSPYVYHPASYVPSNNAWVHESIQSFYLKIDQRSCPAATVEAAQKTQELLDFARQYQQTCPANALVLVKQILVVVRVVVTDVALILSSVLSMGIRLLSLLVTGNTNQIKNSIMDEWSYIQSKGQTMLASMSGILVDAMLNSGSMGTRIKQFLQTTCEKINSALQWFLQVW